MVTIVLLTTSLLVQTTAQAHPHAWYDLKVQVVDTYPANLKINSRDYGEAMRFPKIDNVKGKTPIYGFIWTMKLDEVSAAPIVVDLERGRRQQIWQELATNLVNSNFFTKITYKDKPLSFLKAVAMIDVKIQKDKTLLIKYFAPLSKPVVLTTAKDDVLVLKTYDKAYWLDLKYRNRNTDITFSDRADLNKCDYDVENASPSQTLIDYATALKADENPNDPDIGRHFTQTLYIGCPLRTTF